MQPILLTGGTGTLGRVLVSRLLQAGTPVRVLSRRPRGNRLANPAHLVYISIVGVDRVPLPYYRGQAGRRGHDLQIRAAVDMTADHAVP